jgi:hypothetical protein
MPKGENPNSQRNLIAGKNKKPNSKKTLVQLSLSAREIAKKLGNGSITEGIEIALSAHALSSDIAFYEQSHSDEQLNKTPSSPGIEGVENK